MPILVKGDYIRSGTKANPSHGQLQLAQASTGKTWTKTYNFCVFSKSYCCYGNLLCHRNNNMFTNDWAVFEKPVIEPAFIETPAL